MPLGYKYLRAMTANQTLGSVAPYCWGWQEMMFPRLKMLKAESISTNNGNNIALGMSTSQSGVQVQFQQTKNFEPFCVRLSVLGHKW